MACDITKTMNTGKLGMSSIVADEHIKSLMQPLANNRNASEMAHILVGFQDMVYKLQGSDALDVINNGDRIGKNMDELVNIHTAGKYNNLPSLLTAVGHETEGAMSHLIALGNKALSVMDRLAAYRVDFSAGEKDETYSDFMRMYGNFIRQNQLTKFGANILGGDSLIAGSIALANYGPLIAKDTQLFDLDTAYTGINSAIKTNNNNVKELIDKAFKAHNMKGYIKTAELNKFMNITSGKDYVESDLEALKMAEDLILNSTIAPVMEHEVLKRNIADKLVKFKQAFDMINYGVDLRKLDADIGKAKQAFKEANPTLDMTTEQINALKVAYLSDEKNLTFMKTDDGDPVAPIFWMMHKQGRRVREIIEMKRKAGVEIIPIEDRMSKAFDPNNPQAKVFSYYSPSKLDDHLDLTGLSQVSQGIAAYPAFFKPKKTQFSSIDEVDVQSVMHENMKKFQYTMEKLSNYSISSLQNKIIDNRYDSGQVNPDMNRAYRLIYNRNDNRLKRLTEESVNKQYQEGVQRVKQFASAYQTLAAGTILTKSALNNYLGGFVSIASSVGLKEGFRLVSDYRNARKSGTPIEKATRQLVDHHLSFINPVSTKSEMVLKDLDRDVDGRLGSAFNMMTNAMHKTGDWMMNKGLLGWIPAFKSMAFNQSEDNISKFYNALLYDRVSEYMKTSFEGSDKKVYDASGDGTLSKDFTDTFQEALHLFESDARRRGYQAVGQYDDNAKPLFATKLKTAESIRDVLSGTFLSTMFMFKQVEQNNMGLLNRLASTFAGSKNINFKDLSKNMMSSNTPGAMGVALGLVLTSFYEWLADEYEFLPQMFNAYNAVPTKLPKDVALTAAGIYNVMSGDDVHPAYQQSMIDLIRFGGGVAVGSSMSEALMDKFSDNSKLTPYIKRWARAMNVDESYGSLLMKAPLPFDNVKELMSYQSQLKLARAKTSGLFAQNDSGISIGSLPFINITPFGTSTGLSKILQDVALIASSSVSAFSLPDGQKMKALQLAMNNTVQLGKDIAGISLYIPESSKEYNKYYDDFNEYKIARLAWEYEYHDKPQTAQLYRDAQQQLNRTSRMPYIQKPVYMKSPPGGFKYSGRPLSAEQLANAPVRNQQYNNQQMKGGK